MSIEMSVLSNRALRSIEEWQSAITAEGFPLVLDREVQLETAKGFLPAELGGEETGFECYHDDAVELIESYPDIDFGERWTCALGLRIGGDFAELRAAWMAATAYARATGGVVWDGESGEIMSPDRAADLTREIIETAPSG